MNCRYRRLDQGDGGSDDRRDKHGSASDRESGNQTAPPGPNGAALQIAVGKPVRDQGCERGSAGTNQDQQNVETVKIGTMAKASDNPGSDQPDRPGPGNAMAKNTVKGLDWAKT